jgi:hypothetical protein
MLNWRGYGRKRPWPDLRYYSGICLEGRRKATKTQSGEPNRDLNPGPPKYKAGFLTQTRRSVEGYDITYSPT